MTVDIARLFAEAGCAGQVCVRSLETKAEGGVDVGELVVPASVIKVLVAITTERAFATGEADPKQRVTLSPGTRTGGPVGFSLYEDDVELSARDLVVSMLTISDNAATDALLNCVGLEACNALASQVGMADTRLISDIGTMIDSIGQDAGFPSWNALTDWLASGPRVGRARPSRGDAYHRA
jgi:beta-lactamase class A